MVKIDIHIHSNHSDGLYSIKEIVKKAKEKGLDGIALTDHDTVSGLEEARIFAEKMNFIVIPGIEVSAKEGHIIGLGISTKIRKDMSAEKTIEHIHKQDGLAIASHPYGSIIHRNSVKDLIKKLNFDAVEVFNSRNLNENKKAIKIATEENLVQVAGSDAHMLSEIGKAYTIANCEKNIEAFLNKIREKNVLWIGNRTSLKTECIWKLKSVYSSIANKKTL